MSNFECETIDTLAELIALCRKNDIARVKWMGVELEFKERVPRETDGYHQESIASQMKPTKPGINLQDPDLNMPSDKDMMEWSTPLTVLEELKK